MKASWPVAFRSLACKFVHSSLHEVYGASRQRARLLNLMSRAPHCSRPASTGCSGRRHGPASRPRKSGAASQSRPFGENLLRRDASAAFGDRSGNARYFEPGSETGYAASAAHVRDFGSAPSAHVSSLLLRGPSRLRPAAGFGRWPFSCSETSPFHRHDLPRIGLQPAEPSRLLDFEPSNRDILIKAYP